MKMFSIKMAFELKTHIRIQILMYKRIVKV